jgi:hypothetical protein
MTSFPVIVTVFMLQIGLTHGFVIMFITMPMTVPLLVPAKTSQVIFAFLLAIMAVSVFAVFLISLRMLGHFMAMSILGFIRVGQ